MKKLFLLFVGVFCATAAVAAPSTAKNTMKMVAYFPVPYVAYDTVSATQALELGVLNQCKLSLGENTSNLGDSNCSLYLHGNADGTDDSKRGLLAVSSGKLDLNASGFGDPLIKSTTVVVGSGGQPHYGWLDIGMPASVRNNPAFNALYVSSLANKGNSLRAKEEASVSEFKMFDEINGNFPACNGTATWQALELGANTTAGKTYKDVYLVCDNGTSAPDPEPEPDPDKTCSANEPELISQKYQFLIFDMGREYWSGEQDSTDYRNAIGEGDCSSGAFGKISYTGDGACASPEDVSLSDLSCTNEEVMSSRELKDFSCIQCVKKNGFQYIYKLTCKYKQTPVTWTCASDQFCGETKGECY